MKPVAWKHTVIRDNVITHDPADIRTHPERWEPLFSADQLRQAKVEVLREATKKFHYDCDCGCPCDCYGPSTAKFQLIALADEIEKEVEMNINGYIVEVTGGRESV